MATTITDKAATLTAQTQQPAITPAATTQATASPYQAASGADMQNLVAQLAKNQSSSVVPGTGLLAQYNNESARYVNDLYDKQLAAQQQALTNAYTQNLSDQEAAKAQIGKTYQASANDMAVQYERNRRNLNEQALANGLNTGTGSQQQLALNQQWQRNYGTLRGQESAANTEAERQIVNLKNTYQNNIAQAIADNDYKRAAALFDEYNNNQARAEKQAAQFAQYGDFSIYEQLYGKEAADQARKVWIAQNPLLAYNTGAITAAKYKKLTGLDAPGTAKKATNTGGGNGGAGGGGGNQTTGKLTFDKNGDVIWTGKEDLSDMTDKDKQSAKAMAAVQEKGKSMTEYYKKQLPQSK